MNEISISTPPITTNGVITEMITTLQAGGPVVGILLTMSMIALAIIFLKLWQFSGSRLGDREAPRAALRFYHAGRPSEALAVAERSRHPVAQVLALAMRGQRRQQLSESKVREEVVRVGSELLKNYRAYLRVLEVIASLAPLLGLFGTVLGIIEAFRHMEQAGSQINPAILSGGIWVALLTTAVGLAVAMPVVAILNWLESIVEGLRHDMENAVTQVFTENLSAAQEVRHEHGNLETVVAGTGD